MKNINTTPVCPFHKGVNDISQLILSLQKSLISLNEVNDSLPSELKAHRTALQKFQSWVLQFLSRPNLSLGRKGAVCPYTKRSHDLDHFWVTVNNSWQISSEELLKTLNEFKNIFKILAPNAEGENIFKTITILFPSLPLSQIKIIAEVQEKLKPEFVREGLMIGQFFPGCIEPGLHNTEFRPLNSPIPLLAIRNMVASDFPFLRGNSEFEKVHNFLFIKSKD